MNGLQVLQTTEYYWATTAPATTAPAGYRQTAGVTDMSICNPLYLKNDIWDPSPMSSDAKLFFRQEKLTGMIYNNSPSNIFVDLYYMVARKNILRAEYGSIEALLSDNAVAVNWWLTSPTTSNTAQRYLKFLRHKRFIMKTGAIRKFSFRSKKYPANKQISQDVEGNGLFLGIKGFTQWCFVKMTPPPFTYYNNTTTQFDGSPTLQSATAHFVLSRYTSWYRLGNNDPSSVYSKDFGVPASLFTSDGHVWTETTQQYANIPNP